MFTSDKSHGEGISCVMCRTLVGADAVQFNDIESIAGFYHPSCFRVIEGLVRAWRTLGRAWGG